MALEVLTGPAVRYKKDQSVNGDLLAGGAYGEIFIDDGTGFVSGATPSAVAVKASPVKAGRLNRVSADGATNSTASAVTATGQLTVSRPGDYRVYGHGDMLSGNSAVAKIEVFLNGAVVADAAASQVGGAIKFDLTFAGTAVLMAWSLEGLLTNLKGGDLVDVRVTSNVGTVTIKHMRVGIYLVADTLAPLNS